jgi:CBS domain-containing protein
MEISEFADAYDEDDPTQRTEEERGLGSAILNAPIRALDPRPAAQVPENASVREAIRLMLEHGIGAVLVVRERRVVGIFTERDVLRRVATGAVDPARPVTEVMTPDPETLSLDDGIAFALNRMTVGGFRNVPIVDDAGAPLAILSQRDVVAYIVSLLPRRILNLPPEPKLEAHSPDGG